MTQPAAKQSPEKTTAGFPAAGVRLAFFLATLLALVVYWFVVELPVYLDKQLTEHATGVSIWNAMRRSLPAVRYQALMQAAFVVLAITVLVGGLALVWFASAIEEPRLPEQGSDSRSQRSI